MWFGVFECRRHPNGDAEGANWGRSLGRGIPLSSGGWVALYHHSEWSAHVTEHSPVPSVCLSVVRLVGLSVRKVYCGKMVDWIRMSLGTVGAVPPGIRVIDEGLRASRGRVDFGVVRPIGPMVSMAYFVTEMYSTRA